MYKRFSIIMLAVALSSCGTPQQKASALEENKEAKSLLEGIWLDDNTETALLRVKGDTLFYADAATAPVAFKIIGDSLITYGARTNGYKIEKQEEHTFWFHSAVGDVIRLHKSDTENDSLAFIHTREIPVYNEVIKKDSVVTYDNVRYRGYVYINPSKIKVMRPGVSEEGLGVDNVYYDNIYTFACMKAGRVFMPKISPSRCSRGWFRMISCNGLYCRIWILWASILKGIIIRPRYVYLTAHLVIWSISLLARMEDLHSSW